MHVFLFSFTAYAFNFRVCVGVILLAVFTVLQLSGSYCMYFPPRYICVACSYFGVAGVMQLNAFVQECVVITLLIYLVLFSCAIVCFQMILVRVFDAV